MQFFLPHSVVVQFEVLVYISVHVTLQCVEYKTWHCIVVDAIEQRDGKRPLRELEERALKPYKRR